MEYQIVRYYPSLNSFHHTESLLFQFLLSEFLQTFAIFIEIDKLAGADPLPSSKIKDSLQSLTGRRYNSIQSAIADHEEGPLLKLQAYTDLLCVKWNKGNGRRALLNLQKLIHQAKLLVLEVLETLFSYNKEKFLMRFGKLQKACQLLKKAIEKALPCFKKDENVLFFLLRHSTQFSAIYGSEFLPNVILKMYPKGMDEAKSFLQKAYARRKFNHLIPLIHSYFEHLELIS